MDEKESEIVRVTALLAGNTRESDRTGTTLVSAASHTEVVSGTGREGTSPGRTETLHRDIGEYVSITVAPIVTKTHGLPHTGNCTHTPHTVHCGKTPLLDPFTGRRSELRLDDWLPNQKRAVIWNGWINEELLMPFSGHLHGRGLIE